MSSKLESEPVSGSSLVDYERNRGHYLEIPESEEQDNVSKLSKSPMNGTECSAVNAPDENICSTDVRACDIRKEMLRQQDRTIYVCVSFQNSCV